MNESTDRAYVNEGAADVKTMRCGEVYHGETGAKITSLKVSIGGYFGGYFHAIVDAKNKMSQWNLSTNSLSESDFVRLGDEMIGIFQSLLVKSNLLGWDGYHIEPSRTDGVIWSVEIEAEGETVRKYGDNRFPAGWELFYLALKTVTTPQLEAVHALCRHKSG